MGSGAGFSVVIFSSEWMIPVHKPRLNLREGEMTSTNYLDDIKLEMV